MEAQLDAIAEEVLRAADRLGADQAEAYVASNRLLTIRMVNNGIFESKSVENVGVGVRIATEGGLGFATTSDLTRQAIEATVLSAVKAARKRKFPFKFNFPAQKRAPNVQGLYDGRLAELDPDGAAELAYGMIQASSDYSRLITDNSGVLNVVEYSIFIANTSGLGAADRGTMFEASLSSTARKDGVESEGADATAGRSLEQLNPEEIGENAAEMAVDGLDASPLEDGEYTIIFWFQPAGVIGNFLRVLTSPVWAKKAYPLLLGKVGRRIASENVSFYDDQARSGGIGSCTVDDEGNPARKVPLIERGVLRSLVYDTFHSKLDERRRTGGACRNSVYTFSLPGSSVFLGKSYWVPPDPVALNPVIAAGDEGKEAIVKETRDGLLAKRFHYTRLTNPTRGDFTSVLRMGLYRVRDGEVKSAISKSRLVGNLLEMLKNVDMVSRELRVGGWWGEYATAPVMRSKVRVMPIR